MHSEDVGAAELDARWQRAASALPMVERMLDDVLAESGRASSLAEMARYHFESGGKRLRALIPLLLADALGYAIESMVPFSAACEMLHNATLVHDDLQDGDTTRRGWDTVWHKYGVPQAINLGDAMFYFAVLLCYRLPADAAIRERTSLRILRSTLRVIDGQEREFAMKQQAMPSLEDYFTMVEGKTSGLFALPLAGAAELAGATETEVLALEKAALHLGVLFQIQDDVLDLYGDKGRGAPGSDIAEGKRSVLIVHALGHAGAAECLWLRAVLDSPREATAPADIARAIAMLRDAGSLSRALEEIRARRVRAEECLRAPGVRPELLHVVLALSTRLLEPIAGLMSGRTVDVRT